MNLLLLRKSRHITQKELAQDLQISQQVLSRYERSEVEMDYKTLSKVAEYFDVSIDYLLGVSEYYYPDRLSATVLTDEEKELVETFRRLPPNLQGIAIQTLHSFAGDQERKDQSDTLPRRA